MKRLAGGAVLLVGLVSACGGGREQTGPDHAYPAEGGFCAALAEAECNDAVVKACYGSEQSTIAQDRASCVEARAARCNPAGLPYRPDQAEDCVATREKALADAVWTKDELAGAEAACLPVLSKEGPEGAACSHPSDCDAANGLTCVVKIGQLQGVCGAPKIMEGGEDCSDPLAVCSEVFYCDPQVSHCLARPGMEDRCSASVPCAADFYCTDVDAGTCLVKTKNGLGCERDELCQGGFCIGATPAAPGICSSTLPLQINAESCNLYRQ